jgi:hypothetical protein
MRSVGGSLLSLLVFPAQEVAAHGDHGLVTWSSWAAKLGSSQVNANVRQQPEDIS